MSKVKINTKNSQRESDLTSRLVQLIPDIVVGLEEESRIVIFNKFAEKITGYKAEEVIGKRWVEVFVPKKIQKEIYSVFNDIVKKKLVKHSYENPIVTRRGEELIISWNSTVLTEKGNFKLLLSVGEDVTKRKELEDEVIKEKEEQQIILDSIPALIFYKDKENHFIHVNNAFAEAMGMQKSQLEGKSLFDTYPKNQAQKYLSDDKEVIRSGKPKVGIIEEMSMPKGVRLLQVDKIPYKNDKGEIIGIIAFAIDITERKKIEEAKDETLGELQKFKELMVGRELKMVELKQKIADLETKLQGVSQQISSQNNSNQEDSIVEEKETVL
jgi:PAS domain S-box-containing protein